MFYLGYLYLFTSSEFPFQMIFMSLNSNTTCVNSRTGSGNLPANLSSPSVLSGFLLLNRLFSV